MSVDTPAVNIPKAPDDGVTVEMECPSFKSTSVKSIVPVSVKSKIPGGVANSSTAPVTSATSTIGTSFVPIILRVTS